MPTAHPADPRPAGRRWRTRVADALFETGDGPFAALLALAIALGAACALLVATAPAPPAVHIDDPDVRDRVIFLLEGGPKAAALWPEAAPEDEEFAAPATGPVFAAPEPKVRLIGCGIRPVLPAPTTFGQLGLAASDHILSLDFGGRLTPRGSGCGGLCELGWTTASESAGAELELPPQSAVSLGELSAIGPREEAAIEPALRRALPRLRYCYDRQRVRSPELAGDVMLKFTVLNDGEVGVAKITRSTLEDPLVAACLERAAMQLRFPPLGRNGGLTLVRAPLRFAPPLD